MATIKKQESRSKNKVRVVKFKNAPTKKSTVSKPSSRRNGFVNHSETVRNTNKSTEQKKNIPPFNETSSNTTQTIPEKTELDGFNETSLKGLQIPSGKKILSKNREASKVEVNIISKQNQQESHFFPKIYRFITEMWFIVMVLALILLGSIVIIAHQLIQNLEKKNNLSQKRQQIYKEVTYWQDVTKKYKGYRDGYFKLAVLEYQLGNLQQSQQYLNEVALLDPNFKEGDGLEKLLISGKTLKT